MNRFRTWLAFLLLAVPAWLLQADAMIIPLHTSGGDLAAVSSPSLPTAKTETWVLVYVYDSENPYNGVFCYVQSPSGLFGEGFTGFVASKIAGFANERMNKSESEFARNFWAAVAQGYEQNAANDKIYQAWIKGQRLAEGMTKGDGTADRVALEIIGEQSQELMHEAAEMTPVPDFMRMCDKEESGFARFVYGWSGAGKTILLLLPLKGGGVKTGGGAEATVRTPAVVRPPPLPNPVPSMVMPGEAGAAATTVTEASLGQLTRQSGMGASKLPESQATIDSVLADDLRRIDFRVRPEQDASVILERGRAERGFPNTWEGARTRIGWQAFESPNRLRETLVHEEMHHRLWRRYPEIIKHHGTSLGTYLENVVRRYMQLRNWE